MKVDHLIIGQGLCGTLLSRQLLRAGRSVLVIDNARSDASSRVAGGLVNPVTGKRLVRSWMTDQLLPVAENEYHAIGNETGTILVKRTSILDFHYTHESATLFAERAGDDMAYLELLADTAPWGAYFRFNYGIGCITPALVVDLNALLNGWRQALCRVGAMLEATYHPTDLKVDQDRVYYQETEAKNVIFCDGAASARNPWFGSLPWSDDKGEALVVAIPDLPREHVYKQGISIVPWKDDLFWVGASHDWKNPGSGVTEAFRNATIEQLNYWLKVPFEIKDHISALRPANFDRKPFVGFHPVIERVGIFNGMGGKGISMAPWFAKAFADNIVNNTPMQPDVEVARYRKLLERSLP